jgi:putative IMPACT (imprinted ancient) family translation regulator
VIVVRYFGGTLLGVGGLIQAYKAAAAEAIAAAGVEEQHVLRRYTVSFDAEDTSAVMRILREHEAVMENNSYDTRSHVSFLIKQMHSRSLEDRFAGLYRVTLVAE